jgi:hypothetical protein
MIFSREARMAGSREHHRNRITLAPRIARWAEWLAEPTNNATLALFRIVFGLLIFIEINKTWVARVEMISIKPVRFPYLGFEWVPLVPGSAAIAVHAILALACVCIAAGIWFRVAAIVFTVSYTYTFLVDRAYFNNHFYLNCMLGGWLAVGDAHRRWSLDVARFPALASHTVPRWHVLGPAIQMAIPYVFGGIAKINPDWLRGEPMRAMLWGLSDYPLCAGIALASHSVARGHGHDFLPCHKHEHARHRYLSVAGDRLNGAFHATEQGPAVARAMAHKFVGAAIAADEFTEVTALASEMLATRAVGIRGVVCRSERSTVSPLPYPRQCGMDAGGLLFRLDDEARPEE